MMSFIIIAGCPTAGCGAERTLWQRQLGAEDGGKAKFKLTHYVARRLTSTRRAVGQVWLSIVVIKYLPAVNESVNSASRSFPLENTPTAPSPMNPSAGGRTPVISP